MKVTEFRCLFYIVLSFVALALALMLTTFLTDADKFVNDLDVAVHNIDKSVTNGRATLVEAQSAFANINGLVSEAHYRLIDTSKNANAILIQVGLAADNVRRASESQHAYNVEVQKLISDSDNTVLAAGASLQSLTALESETATGVAANSAELVKTLQSAQKAVSDLDAIASSDQTKYIMTEVASTSSRLAATSSNLEGATYDIETYVHRLTRPASLPKQLLGWVSSAAKWFVR